MSKKKVFALRLDEDVYASIERWANDEFRSTNGQLEWIVAKALKESGRKKQVNKDDEVKTEND